MPFTLGSEIHSGIVRANEYFVAGVESSIQARINALAARISLLETGIEIVLVETPSEEGGGSGGITLLPP